MDKTKQRNFRHFEETMEDLGLNRRDLSKACGYTGGAWNHWKKTGKIPAVAGLACECLRRRSGNNRSNTLHIVSIPKNQREAAERMFQILGINHTIIDLNF